MLFIRGKREYLLTNEKIAKKLKNMEEDIDGCFLLDVCPEFGLNIDIDKKTINVIGDSVPDTVQITGSTPELLFNYAAKLRA